MATTSYLCEACGTAFQVEGGCCCEPAEAAKCPKCGDVKAKKQPETAKPAGGCACGGSCS